MKNIAVILTCHNRKEKTLKCLESLFVAYNNNKYGFIITVYLTDDGSLDGTTEAVRLRYPEIHILPGNGNLYWAGGMRNSWKEALNKNFDCFLLLNDDTFLLNNVFIDYLKTDKYSKSNFKKSGIYIGSTKDEDTQELTYGGAKLLNIFFLKYKKIQPIGIPILCDLGNANIMFVSKESVEQIGILYDKYKHGVADYDYTLMANKNNIPVLVMPEYCGLCENEKQDKYEIINKISFTERIKYLYAPTGLAFHDNLLFMKRNFPYRIPFIVFAAMMKVLAPSFYTKFAKKRKN